MGEAPRAEAAVLVLMWGDPPHVLLERKSCSVNSRFSCDVAFPGGRIMEGEDSVRAALREAWEEASVPPSYVEVIGSLGIFSTKSRPIIYTEAIEARLRGPLDPRPTDPEVDAVFWVDLASLPEPGPVMHVRRGSVMGIELGPGLVLWGLSLRIVAELLRTLGIGWAAESVKGT